ncbi:glycosyltransferase family 39 protein [Halobaculum halobium]|uniref:Glycosyltransferase family 39 protein n=1 Tax=Halobaculum halobium TaxID=3032281 RepID=A0ABD5TCI5_9EURY|nr:glycosyltransferase family 39 protein [Halobaculum sp. SYNS20]
MSNARLRSLTETLSHIQRSLTDRLPITGGVEFLILVLLTFTILAHINLFTIRVPRDAGAFLTIADGILEGQLPYREYVDHKPPGIYYTLAAVLVIDRSVETARTLLLVTNVATSALLVTVARNCWSRDVGLLAALLYLAALPLYQGVFLLTEPFLALALVATVVMLSRYVEHRDLKFAAAAGFAIGAALLFKQVALAGLPIFAVAIVILPAVHDNRLALPISYHYLRPLVPLAIGFAVPLLITSGYFIANDSIGELLFWTTTANVGYGIMSPTRTLKLIIERVGLATELWLIAAISTGLLLTVAKREWAVWGAVFTALLVATAVPLIVHQFHHYFITMLPFVVLLTAGGIFVAGEWLAERFELSSVVTRRGLIIGVLVITSPIIGPTAINTVTVPGGDGTLADQRVLADRIAMETDPNEPIVLLSAEPQFYFLADRRPMGRNVYYLPINRGISYTDAGLARRIASTRPPVVIIRDCRTLSRSCMVVRDQYLGPDDYHRGLRYWRDSESP